MKFDDGENGLLNSSRTQEILKFRTENYKNRSRSRRVGSRESVLVFSIGKNIYGMCISKMNGISPLLNISRVPKSPSCVLGLLPMRGEIYTVMCLPSLLGGDPVSNTNLSQGYGVLLKNNSGLKVGIYAEALQTVDEIESELLPKDEMKQFIRPNLEGGFQWIDIDRLLTGTFFTSLVRRNDL